MDSRLGDCRFAVARNAYPSPHFITITVYLALHLDLHVVFSFLPVQLHTIFNLIRAHMECSGTVCRALDSGG